MFCHRDTPGQTSEFDALLSSNEQYHIEICAVAEAPPSHPTPLSLAQRDGKIIVDTGVARYILGRGNSPIKEIQLAGKRIASGEDARGLYVIDQDSVGYWRRKGKSGK